MFFNFKKRQMLAITCLISFVCINASAQDKPLKVFILVGQSNMQGHAHIRTLKHIGLNPETKSILSELQDQKGQPRVFENIWISYLSSNGVKAGQLTTGFGADENKIGPELTFGIYMQKKLNEPILIIKTAWGGKSLNTDFRPPSAGPYEFDPAVLERHKQQGKDIKSIRANKEKATGVYYRKTVDHVKSVLADIKSIYPDYDSKQGFQLAGMVWFQGWNDMVDRGTYPRRGEKGGYQQYSELLAQLIRDFRKDLSAPKLPFVIGVMGVGGPTEKYSPQQKRYQKVHQGFRDAMAAPASQTEFKDNVFLVLTEDYWDLELDALIARDAKLKNELKRLQSEGKIDKKDRQATLQKLRAEEFSERERMILQTGVSNAAFHYLGCSKIMAQIGKGFAEALPVTTTQK